MPDASRSQPRQETDDDKNIVFNPLPALSWEKSRIEDSVRKLAEHASREAQLAIRWYLDRKRSQKNWARSLRFLAIIATALAGVIPLISQVWSSVSAIWGSVALIVAATAVGLDRFFGFSSAWMRFLTTEMQIRQALHRFLFDWEAKQAKLGGSAPDEKTAQALVQRCRDFIEEVDQILRDEMDEWVNEFRQNLSEIDQAAKAEAQAGGLGAVTVIVTNGEQCADGWEVWIDERAPSRHQGKSAAFRGVSAGSHTLRASGSIGGKTVHAETAFVTVQGRSEEVSLTLA